MATAPALNAEGPADHNATGPADRNATGPADHNATATRLSTWTMTREALTIGFDAGDGFLGRTRGHDMTRFRCGGRCFVSISHPDYVEHVLHRARLKYVKSNDYEPIRAAAGINLLTDEGDSWAAHRATLNPTFARRHLNEMVDLMIDPIEHVTAGLTAQGDTADRDTTQLTKGPTAQVDTTHRDTAQRDRVEFDMHAAMVEATLRVVANALFSQDFGPLVGRMNDLATRGLRRAERLERFGLWGLLPRPVYDALTWCTFAGVPLPPPLREGQKIALALDAAVNAVLDERLAHPTESDDLLNVLLRADNGTWPRKRVRDEALTFMLAGHETTANAMSWFWYLMARNADARARMFAEIDGALGARRPTADDLARLPWTTACLQESQRYFSAVWIIAREAIEDDVIDGHRIRRGTTVIVPIHHIHHDPRWWREPERFDPTRFVGDAPKSRPRSAYLPFGGGRRMCIGQSFAMMEMVLIAAIMGQRFVFDIFDVNPDLTVELEATLTLRPKHGLAMIGSRRATT